MNYELIVQKIKKNVGKEVYYHKHLKGKKILNAIVIGNENIRPQFYVESFMEKFKTEEEIANAISEFYKLNENETKLRVPNISDFNSIKNMIIPCVVNEKAFIDNDICLKTYLNDINVSYRVFIDENASFIIKKQMLDVWGISLDELHKISLINLENSNYSFRDMQGVLCELYEEVGEKEEINLEENFMYILSNKTRVYGANNLLNIRVLENIRKKIGNYFIIPSSIHELIIVPYSNENNEVAEIKNMIKEVNENVLNEDELLSSFLYAYTDKNKLFQVA